MDSEKLELINQFTMYFEKLKYEIINLQFYDAFINKVVSIFNIEMSANIYFSVLLESITKTFKEMEGILEKLI